ncbi:MAG TPA: protease complex subunit PrcB family protein [Opitutaceae bacterium]|nr:protease complex subunit PrcB family protein [Opitutaceae bacterium]
MKTRLLLLAAAVFGAALIAAAADSTPPALPQWHGQYGGSPTLTTEVLRTTEQWGAFWKQVDKDAPRPLDPLKEMAVVIFIGQKPTGGFVPSVLSAGVEKESFVVVYDEGAPGPDKFVTQALTTPWVVAIVPLSDRPVVFQAKAK